jgi:hypothetical protein
VVIFWQFLKIKISFFDECSSKEQGICNKIFLFQNTFHKRQKFAVTALYTSYCLVRSCTKVQSCRLATAVMVLYKSMARRNPTGILFSSQWLALQLWKKLLGVLNFGVTKHAQIDSWFNAKLWGNFGVGWSSDTFVWGAVVLEFCMWVSAF